MARAGETSSRMVGRYLLHSELAHGGMATIHLGRLSGPEGFSRTVAIKRLHAQYAKDENFVAMFRDEARLVGRIRHPNVVPTLDVVTTNGELFIVMEYIAGESLSKLVNTSQSKGEPIANNVLASIVSSVLHGLHAAHQTKDEHGVALGIVHRDVSPQNILVGVDGAARVLDFGVAKAAGRLQTTREGELKGKIAYMAPEQLSGAAATCQADVYAASVVLWEALARRRLFDGESEAVVFARALEGRIDPPSKYNPLVSPAVDALVMRGLSRDPARRFATAREMALQIEQTMGLASPSEIGGWVERIAHDALHRRAQKVAAVEVAAVHAPLPPSQSVERSSQSDVFSHPAVAVSVPIQPRRMKALLGAFLCLAAIGGSLVVVARHDAAAATHVAAPNIVEGGTARPLDRLGPPSAAEKASAAPSSPTVGSTAQAATVQAAAAPRQSPSVHVDSKAACDPPYIIDPVTGRRAYKRSCF